MDPSFVSELVEYLVATHRSAGERAERVAQLARMLEIEPGSAETRREMAQSWPALSSELKTLLLAEEKLAFPWAMDEAHVPAQPVALMSREHEEVRQLARRVDAVRFDDARDAAVLEAAGVARALGAILRRHLAREDHLLLPAMRRAVDALREGHPAPPAESVAGVSVALEHGGFRATRVILPAGAVTAHGAPSGAALALVLRGTGTMLPNGGVPRELSAGDVVPLDRGSVELRAHDELEVVVVERAVADAVAADTSPVHAAAPCGEERGS